MIGDHDCYAFKFLRRSVEGKYFRCFQFSWALNFEHATRDVFPLTALPSLAKHFDVLLWYDFQLVGLLLVARISGISS